MFKGSRSTLGRSRSETTQREVAIMACLQSFDPLPGGPPASKSSSSSLKEDSKDDRVRRQLETPHSYEDQSDVTEPLCSANQRWLWVEQQGVNSHRTFIATGDRYEMVRFDSETRLCNIFPCCHDCGIIYEQNRITSSLQSLLFSLTVLTVSLLAQCRARLSSATYVLWLNGTSS